MMRIAKPFLRSARRCASLLAAFATLLAAPCLQAAAINPGFEVPANAPAGTVPPAPWSVQTYLVPGTGIPHYPPQAFADLGLLAGGVGNTVIVSSAGGPGTQSDLALGASALLHWPLFGNQSAVVNGPETSAVSTTGANKNVNVLRQTYPIGPADVDPNDSQIHIRFAVAPVIQYGGHSPASLEAYTFIEVTNVTRATQLYHAFYNYDYDGFDPWQTTTPSGSLTPFYYTNWRSIDISPGASAVAVGDQIQLTFVAAGCAPGAHEAHLYVDSSPQNAGGGLSVAASAPLSVAAGSDITYSFAYRSSGPIAACVTSANCTPNTQACVGGFCADTNVSINVLTPANLTFQSVQNPPGATCPAPTSGTLTCTFTNPVPPNSSGTFTATYLVAPNTPSPLYFDNYQIQSTQTLPLLGPLVQTTVLTPTSTALGSDTNPASFGQSVTFTASVAVVAPATGTPTGAVTFNDGATALCSQVALSNGNATCPAGTLAVGTHSITAVYSNDPTFAPSTSNTLTQQVDKATSTVGVDSPCMRTFVGGQPFTLDATVTGQSPSGTVTFDDGSGGTLCGNVTLTGGAATCTSNALVAQGAATQTVFNLGASYSGDGNNASGTSAALTVTVLSATDAVFRSDYEVVPNNCPSK